MFAMFSNDYQKDGCSVSTQCELNGRKPDDQAEFCAWTAQKIAQLVEKISTSMLATLAAFCISELVLETI